MSTLTSPSSAEQDGTAGRSRRVRWLALGMVAAIVLVVVLVVFQPQRLLFDTVVDEPFPQVQAPPASTAPSDGDVPSGSGSEQPTGATDTGADADADDGTVAVTPAEPTLLAAGGFTSRHRYEVQGDASVYELPDGSSVLRLEDGFASTNGPQLHVYLVAADADADDAAFEADAVDLGPLTGNVGAQNYPLPAGVDPAVYDTAVIWCVPFSRGFGAADLVAP